MILTVLVVFIYLSYTGYSYYALPIEERFFHPKYDWFKPSGIYGQGLGVIGTLMIVFGVAIYILRKRYGILERWIRLKYLLEFHIFLCTLGPVLILFHTTFKFGGIVSVAFWSMVAVVLSGVIGRFIYIQIPRSIEGKALSMNEVQAKRQSLVSKIKSMGEDDKLFELMKEAESIHNVGLNSFLKFQKIKKNISNYINISNFSRDQKRAIMKLAKEEISIVKKINRLQKMQKWFDYWHVFHLPFAIIMLIIVVIHIVVTISFGYKWIF